jgi:cation:H+ antiporter
VLGVVTPEGLTLGWVGLDSVLVALAYAASVAWIRRSPTTDRLPAASGQFPRPTSLGQADASRGSVRSAVARFSLAALAVLASGPLVALSAEGISRQAGIAESFAGVAFLAVATSLPELVGSLGAVRIGAYDLAVGNLFGSNAVNTVMFLAADLVYVEGRCSPPPTPPKPWPAWAPSA